MKKILIIATTLVLTISLTSCWFGDSSKPGSKTKALFKEANMKQGLNVNMEINEDGINMKIQMQFKDNNSYISFEAWDLKLELVGDGENLYMLDRENKVATIEDKNGLTGNFKQAFAFENISKVIEEKEFTSGNQKIHGKKYYFEAAKGDDNDMKFFFEGDKLAYLSLTYDSKDYYIKVNTFNNKIDKKNLVIPKGYSINQTDTEAF